MVSIVLAMLVASMDTTIVNTTMPIISKSLSGEKLYAWTFAAYMIFSTVCSPLAGRLSDLFGRKKVFASGILLFLIGSVLCGSSETMLMLVIFRAVQGLGAGFMMPFPAIIAGDLFSVEKRGVIQAFFTAMWGLSAIIAPLLGSLFVEFATWRWIFYINIPICLLSLLLLIPYKEVYEAKRAKVDVMGAILFAAGISSLLTITVVSVGHIFYLIGGLVILYIFYKYEKRHPSPIVPLRLFHNKPLFWMIVNSFFSCAALFGAATYLPLFLQEVKHASVFMSGVALLGMSAGWMTMSVPAGKWILRYGYRPLMLIGNGFLIITALYFQFLSEQTGFWFVFIGSILLGLSFGMLTTVAIIGSQQLVFPHEKGVSTSLLMFSRNIGTTVGVTVMGTLLYHFSLNLVNGFHALFLYGLMVSIISLLSALMIHDKKQLKSSLAN